MATIREDLQTLLARAKAHQIECQRRYDARSGTDGEQIQESNRSLLAAMDVVKDLERALHNFSDRPGRGGNADYLKGI